MMILFLCFVVWMGTDAFLIRTNRTDIPSTLHIGKHEYRFVSYTETLRTSEHVYEDIPITTADSISPFGEYTSQWNLDRIDSLYGRDGFYSFSEYSGLGTDIYILDTGVLGTHPAFGDRVLDGINVLTGSAGNTDCHSHGTHIASTAAGTGYGVARSSNIIPVAFLRCDGGGTLADLAMAVSWTVESIITRPTQKAVINLSIQSQGNELIDELIRALWEAGAVVVVAAANFDSDACNYSPAREPVAVTVGASSEDDSKLGSSNFGDCVDLFAPGDAIVGASSLFPVSVSITKRGTSMAVPLVVGVLATLWEQYPEYINEQVTHQLLQSSSILGKLPYDLDCSGSLESNRFLRSVETTSRRVIIARGSFLQGDFTHWIPFTSIRTCFSTSSRIRIAISTHSFTSGIYGYQHAECRDSSARTLVFYGTTITDLFGLEVPARQTSYNENHSFVEANKDRVLFGDSMTKTIYEVRTTSTEWKFVSFSAMRGQDVVYTSIEECGISLPPPLPSLPSHLRITKATRNLFLNWYQRPSCFKFQLKLHRGSRIYLGFSNSASQVALKASGYTPSVMFTHRQLVGTNQSFPVKLARNRKLTFTITKQYLVGNGLVYKLGDEAYISLTSSMAREFTNIRPC
jgi:hypothetical protein